MSWRMTFQARKLDAQGELPAALSCHDVNNSPHRGTRDQHRAALRHRRVRYASGNEHLCTAANGDNRNAIGGGDQAVPRRAAAVSSANYGPLGD